MTSNFRYTLTEIGDMLKTTESQFSSVDISIVTFPTQSPDNFQCKHVLKVTFAQIEETSCSYQKQFFQDFIRDLIIKH